MSARVGENDGDELEGVCGVATSLRAPCGSSPSQVRREKLPQMLWALIESFMSIQSAELEEGDVSV